MRQTLLWATTLAAILGFAGGANAGLVVLIDNYHLNPTDTSTLESQLQGRGYTVGHTHTPITPTLLNGVDVFALFYPSGGGGWPHVSSAEASALTSWVQGGGGLWLGGGMGAEADLNLISGQWGVTYSTTALSGVATDITHGHPVTDGNNPPTTSVDAFGLDFCSRLIVTGGTSLARYNGQTILSAATPGNGRVVFFGDSVRVGPFDNSHIGLYDNAQLAMNTVDFLAANTIPEPSTLIIWSLLGALGISVTWWRRPKAA